MLKFRLNTLSALPLLGATVLLSACAPQPVAPAAQSPQKQQQAVHPAWPKLRPARKADPQLEARIDSILNTLTPAQKVAQIIQPDIRWMSVDDMRQYGFGSYLNGGGAFPGDNKAATAAQWLALAEQMYQAGLDASLDGAAIPPLWGTDAVHGHNNVRGATVFPHNIGLGASGNAELVEAIGRATAAEVAATGIQWIFAPTVAVARDDRWGRSYESYSEDPALVRLLGAALVRGIQGDVQSTNWLQGPSRLATAKHYLGDGGTAGGRDQGNTTLDEAELVRLHAQGYLSTLDAGVQTVMASFNSIHGSKMHGNRYLLTDVLKQQLGFDGIVVGDWNGHGQLPGCSNQRCAAAINAGIDIIMVPEDWKAMYQNTLAQAEAGEISKARLDDAVRRILRVKLRSGLFEHSPAQIAGAGDQQLIGHPAHQALARDAVRQSLVLLKNNAGLLPLPPKLRVLVAGDGADSIPKQSGGWTVSWQGTGTSNADFPQGRTIYSGIAAQVKAAGGQTELSPAGRYQQKPDVAIVVIGENPYAEFDGDVASLDYQAGQNQDEALLKRLKADGIKVVTVFLSGRPLWVNPELNASDAFVAAWLPGTAGDAVAELLFRKPDGTLQHDFRGKLPFSWPKTPDSLPLNAGDATSADKVLFSFGYGLDYGLSNKQSIVPDLPQLDETSMASVKASSQLALFERRPAAGLHLQLLGADAVATEVTANKAATTDGSLLLSAVNWQKQEDALALHWQQGGAMLQLHSSEALDLSRYGQLVFDLKWQQVPAKAVTLAMSCGSGCDGRLDLSPLLAAKAAGQWQKITVDLACFAKAGAALNHLYQPFVLQSEGRVALSLANIRVTPATAAADISCVDD